MPSNKKFKAVVRAHAAKSGMSYTAALRQLGGGGSGGGGGGHDEGIVLPPSIGELVDDITGGPEDDASGVIEAYAKRLGVARECSRGDGTVIVDADDFAETVLEHYGVGAAPEGDQRSDADEDLDDAGELRDRIAYTVYHSGVDCSSGGLCSYCEHVWDRDYADA